MLASDVQVQNWSKTQIEAEIEKPSELTQDPGLALKARTPIPTYCTLLTEGRPS